MEGHLALASGWSLARSGLATLFSSFSKSTAARRSNVGSWEMYFPGPIARRQARAQIGSTKFNFVMRAWNGQKWLYRLPTADERYEHESVIGDQLS